ncbi:MAG: uracil-DNA glycosylase [Clostridia bacterium]|nr:uracil-DNA glycosylase [Clostridia bacterium]
MNVSWHSLMEDIEACRRCGLRDGCSRVVPGEGRPDADLMFIGEGPGADEDRLGRPFVGRAGALLTKMIEAMGLTREDVYICNVVKCRPPHNRQPQPEEIAACLPFLRAQTALVRPRLIVLLGATAGRAVLGPDFRVTRDRGAFVERRGVYIMPTYHPAALLRDESLKRPTWEDLKQVRDRLAALPPR